MEILEQDGKKIHLIIFKFKKNSFWSLCAVWVHNMYTFILWIIMKFYSIPL